MLRKNIFFISFLFIFSLSLFSAAPGSPGTPSCWPPPCIPIDNGVILLVLVGGIYAAIKIRSSIKKHKTSS